ncbi:MAG TPA: hypothetical protein VKO42_01390, partial [Patescibacteria group bacterium]|nr:hypothetical protein [Patescibacteria group bacterium]
MAWTKEHNRSWKWLLWVVAIFFITALLAAALVWGWQKYYQNKIYPGVEISGIKMGGKTPKEAEKILKQKINQIDQNGIPFHFKNNSVNITPIISSFSGSMAYPIMEFQPQQTVKKAWTWGRSGGIFQNINQQIKSLWSPVRIGMKTELREKEI